VRIPPIESEPSHFSHEPAGKLLWETLGQIFADVVIGHVEVDPWN
jgi:hypothetical protein